MRKSSLFLTLFLLGCSTLIYAASEIKGRALGTDESTDNYIHVPQYMPYYPTAAVIWPRVVEVPCEKTEAGELRCEGYNWTPAMGRGEYLFFVPKVRNEPLPPAPPVIIYKEVPVKKGKE